MVEGRVLGVDYGTKAVGLACADELGVTVRPLPSLPNLGRRDLVARLARIVREEGIRSIVLGLPLNMDGTAGRASTEAEGLAGLLRRELGLPLSLTDERLSTVEAQELWREMTARRRRRYRTVDSLAAALILERHLREG